MLRPSNSAFEEKVGNVHDLTLEFAVFASPTAKCQV